MRLGQLFDVIVSTPPTDADCPDVHRFIAERSEDEEDLMELTIDAALMQDIRDLVRGREPGS